MNAVPAVPHIFIQYIDTVLFSLYLKIKRKAETTLCFQLKACLSFFKHFDGKVKSIHNLYNWRMIKLDISSLRMLGIKRGFSRYIPASFHGNILIILFLVLNSAIGMRPSDLYGKFTWKIENFLQISKRELRSNLFEVGGCKW